MTKASLLKIEEIEIFYKNNIPKAERMQVKSSINAYDVLKMVMQNVIEYKEFFYIILLNNSNDVLGVSKISEGGITGTMVDVRLIFQNALKSHATSMILGHNHPSGTLKPSEADKVITRKIKKAGEIMDIKVLDHLIITENSYFSFTDENIN